MYVSDGILKQPSYFFQVAGSTEEQYIFRTLLPNQKRIKFPRWVKKFSRTGDTYRKPSTEFHLDIKNIPKKEINDYNEIGDQINVSLFTAAYYLRKWIRLKVKFFFILFCTTLKNMFYRHFNIFPAYSSLEANF